MISFGELAFASEAAVLIVFNVKTLLNASGGCFRKKCFVFLSNYKSHKRWSVPFYNSLS